MLHFGKWKLGLIAAVVAIGALLALPNAIPGGMPAPFNRVMPSETVRLGLDLQGGAHLLYEVNVAAVRAERLEQGQRDVRRELDNAQLLFGIELVDEAGGGVLVRFEEQQDLDRGLPIIRDLFSERVGEDPNGPAAYAVEQSGLEVFVTISDALLEDIQQRTIESAQGVIRQRIDAFGVSEPSIQRQGRDRILVQAPGAFDTAALEARIGTTANMSFHLVDSDVNVPGIVAEAFEALPAYTPAGEVDESIFSVRSMAHVIAAQLIGNPQVELPCGVNCLEEIAAILAPILRADGAAWSAVIYTQAGQRDDAAEIALKGVIGAELDRRLAAAPLDEGERALANALVSTSGDPTNRRFLADAFWQALPVVAEAEQKLLFRADASQRSPNLKMLVAQQEWGEPFIYVEREVRLRGDQLARASQAFQEGAPVISFRLTGSGSGDFCDLTGSNVGSRFAALLDEWVVSAPVIRSSICGGQGVIEGGFTVESAQETSALLNSGALPADLEVLERRVVGPGTAGAAMRAGAIALVLGFVAVIFFMVLIYRVFGVFANIALITNLVLMVGAVSGLQAVLTLPGIAGIILTVGMAVDANVLIFERIREEVRNGRSPANAIEAGYLRARNTILDANITTFIAAAVLYMVGSGPVQGFAVTLGIGIITSVFTAFVLSRVMVALWLRRTRPAVLPIS